MITRVNPGEAALVSELESILGIVKHIQAPHGLFKAKAKRLRRHADNIEDAVLEALAYLTGLEPGAPWDKSTLDTISPLLSPLTDDLEALHTAIHEEDEAVWASWGPVTPEVAAYMAVEALVPLYQSVGALMASQVARWRMERGITEEEAKAKTSQRPHIQIMGNINDLPPHIRKILGGLFGEQE